MMKYKGWRRRSEKRKRTNHDSQLTADEGIGEKEYRHGLFGNTDLAKARLTFQGREEIVGNSVQLGSENHASELIEIHFKGKMRDEKKA